MGANAAHWLPVICGWAISKRPHTHTQVTFEIVWTRRWTGWNESQLIKIEIRLGESTGNFLDDILLKWSLLQRPQAFRPQNPATELNSSAGRWQSIFSWLNFQVDSIPVRSTHKWIISLTVAVVVVAVIVGWWKIRGSALISKKYLLDECECAALTFDDPASGWSVAKTNEYFSSKKNTVNLLGASSKCRLHCVEIKTNRRVYAEARACVDGCELWQQNAVAHQRQVSGRSSNLRLITRRLEAFSHFRQFRFANFVQIGVGNALPWPSSVNIIIKFRSCCLVIVAAWRRCQTQSGTVVVQIKSAMLFLALNLVVAFNSSIILNDCKFYIENVSVKVKLRFAWKEIL